MRRRSKIKNNMLSTILRQLLCVVHVTKMDEKLVENFQNLTSNGEFIKSSKGLKLKFTRKVASLKFERVIDRK